MLRQLARELAEYFAGRRRVFDVAVAPEGTPFQQAVWRALRTVPYGATASYAAIAAAIDRPRAVRATGAANGRNPVSIVIPCHRIVGADGSLTGYAGGVARKEWLLMLESGIVATRRRARARALEAARRRRRRAAGDAGGDLGRELLLLPHPRAGAGAGGDGGVAGASSAGWRWSPGCASSASTRSWRGTAATTR